MIFQKHLMVSIFMVEGCVFGFLPFLTYMKTKPLFHCVSANSPENLKKRQNCVLVKVEVELGTNSFYGCSKSQNTRYLFMYRQVVQNNQTSCGWVGPRLSLVRVVLRNSFIRMKNNQMLVL